MGLTFRRDALFGALLDAFVLVKLDEVCDSGGVDGRRRRGERRVLLPSTQTDPEAVCRV